MTAVAGLAIERNAAGGCGLRMWVVACPAPQPVARCKLALAPGELFRMVGCGPLSARRIPDKDGHVIGKQISRTKRSDSASRSRHSRSPRQVTLLADAIPACGVEFRRIHDVAMRLDMLLSGTMTAFTPDASFEKRRIEITVLCHRHGLRAAR